jgi:hypothetical protein
MIGLRNFGFHFLTKKKRNFEHKFRFFDCQDLLKCVNNKIQILE